MGMEPMDRRAFLSRSCALAAGAAVTPHLLAGCLEDGKQAVEPAPIMAPLEGAPDSGPLRPVTLDDLSEKRAVVGEWGGLPAGVYKVSLAALATASRLYGYNTGQHAVHHPTETDRALVAYEAKCTHLGCTVGWNDDLGANRHVEDLDEDGRPDGRMLCPCHQAQFDVHDLGRHLEGTPAPRPVPVLRIEVRGDQVWALGRIPQDTARAADREGPGSPLGLSG